MPPAAKHFDPVLGIDVHIIQPPPPAPPLPVPHPHTGIVLDPFDYAPFVGGTVKVGGLQRAQAGTGTMMVPSHIPIGGVFVKPPGNEGEIFMGSSTVAADGDAFSYLALPVLTCQDIGIPAPGRPKGSPPKSLVLPTTVVLSIPLPVQVGGSPTVSLMALGMRAGLAALGAGLKKLKSLDAVASRLKKFSDAVHGKARKLMDALGIPPNLQRKVHDKICSVTGHPVDVATGKVFTVSQDFWLPGSIPIELSRRWYSSSTHTGDFGHGWHHPWEMALFVGTDVVLARLADGRHVPFPDVAEGQTAFELQERLTLGRDANGYWLRDANQLTYRFSGSTTRRLNLVSNDAGDRIVFMRDVTGRLQTIIDSAGRRLHFDTDALGRVVRVDAPPPGERRQRVTVARYTYDGHGDLVRFEDALGRATHYAYRNHLLVTETHPGGLAFHFEYDGPTTGARCVRTWGTGGIYARTIAYDEAAGAATVTDSLGHKTVYRHDGAVVHERIDPCGGVTKTDFDENYWVLATTDTAGKVTQYKYDERGNQIEVISPDGTSIQVEYDAHDRLTKFINQRGISSSRDYDDAGRLVARRNPMGQEFELAYNGLDETIRGPEGGLTVVQRDASSNVVSLALPDGNVVRWDYDGWGRTLRAIGPTGTFEQRSYDLLGRTVRIHDQEGNRTDLEYDVAGNTVRIRHHNREVLLSHAGMGRLTRRTEAGIATAFEYDTEDRLVAVVDGNGGARRFERDACGRVAARTDPSGRRVVFTRDAGGNVARADRPGGRFTAYAYDDVGQIVAVEHEDGTKHAFRYRSDGCLVEAANDTTTVSFERDDLGRLIRESREGHWVASSYATRGRTGIESSLGAGQQFEHNIMGDVVSVRDGDFDAAFSYDELGLETERVFSGDVRCRRRYDRFGREIEQEILRGESTLRSRTLRWGPEDALSEVDDSNAGKTRHGHDVLGGLAWTQHPDGKNQLRMPDAAANLYRSEDRSDRRYGPSGELLWADSPQGRTEYRYDAEGQLVERVDADGGRWCFEWNGAGWLTSVVRPDGETVSFEYDAIGRRVSKTSGGSTQHTLWDQGTPLHEWTVSETGSRGPVTDWIFEPGTLSPLAKRVDGCVLSVVCDRLGTPQMMFDDAGEAVWSTEIDSYGKLRGLEGSANDCPFRWPGQREDTETGLYYNRFRYYDPEAGVYISPDPLREQGGLRAYGYVADVLRAIDPYGLVGENKKIGDIAEAQAKKDLEKAGYKVLGPMENNSGHGIDLVVENPDGAIEVVEVKANSSELNPDQKRGADWYAQDRAEKCLADDGAWAKKKKGANNLADVVLDEIAEKGEINGWVLRYDVKDGKAKMKKAEPWVKCG